MASASFPQSAASEVALRQHARPRGSVLEVTHDVFCLQQSLVNVIFVGPPGAGDRQWVLVDAGLHFSESQIRRAAAELYGAESRPAAILLTHGHFDHVGALPRLADEWDARVFAHELELPYLTGRSSYPPPDPAVGGGAMSLLSRFYPRGPFDFGGRVKPLPPDHSVPGLSGWRWVPTPGHTAGHVSFFRDEDRTLIVGDAFVTMRQESLLAVLTRRQELRRPPAYFTQDWQAAYDSVARLTALLPNIAVTGHGLPMYGAELRRQLNTLVSRWEEIALPAHGRYICQPAIANHVGTVAVPPPVLDRQLLALASIAAGALVGVCLWNASGSRQHSAASRASHARSSNY